MADWVEADIVINGTELTAGYAMVIRVAVTDLAFRMEHEDALGGDQIGRNLAKAYLEAAVEILKMIDGKY